MSFVVWLIMVVHPVKLVYANVEGDALHSLRTNLKDPNSVLQSWDPTLVNPCTWFHVTCNNDNSVIRVDLGNAALSGTLVSQLGLLKNLQYLELYSNNLSGPIPNDLGNLTNLVSLDLYLNGFSGPIPVTLGKLSKLRFLDLSNNRLSGLVPDSGSFSLFTPISFANNLDLCGPVTGRPCPGSPPFSPPPPFVQPPPIAVPGGKSATGAIAGGWLSLVLQVKGLLKEKKLEMLVDPDLETNYIATEVEQLIQVALLCTQGSPMDRPKMSDVVRMLEGDGLAERWEEWQKVEVLRHELDLVPLPNSDWILDSTDNLHAVELSGPR
ncbi:Leucine-rich repeat-containing protein [Cynara cardunculus var. scolymus]|uniref:Leucine-rich repeat-containing protein n=1 Tax=Cynara cardunculus var. scolymus TaxID=59895 RepID=A0A103YDR0_CYNCS|nr:Leucine-rich repeat-containing protein [Cynara cardunculus var. scolymus]